MPENQVPILQTRSIGDHGVIDAGEARDARWDRRCWLDKVDPTVNFALAIVEDGCDFRDVCPGGRPTIGFDVYDGKLHGTVGHGSKVHGRFAMNVRC